MRKHPIAKVIFQPVAYTGLNIDSMLRSNKNETREQITLRPEEDRRHFTHYANYLKIRQV